MIRSIAAALVAAFLCLPVAAQVDLSAVYGSYDSERLMRSDFGWQARAGERLYLWGSYDEPRMQMVGQTMGNIEIWGAGVGWRHDLADRLQVFGEFGYFWPSTDPMGIIRDEAVWSTLRGNHGWEPGWVPEQTTYKLSESFGGRVGLTYEVLPHVVTSVAYRFLAFDESIDAWVGECSAPPGPECVAWWQERNSLPVDTVEFGVGVRF